MPSFLKINRDFLRSGMLLAFALVLNCSVSSQICLAQSDIRIGGPVPEQVKQDWHDRRERCQALHWKIEMREMLTPDLQNKFPVKSTKNSERGHQDSWRTRYSEAWIDFSTKHVRSEKFGQIHFKEQLSDYHKVKLFDGSVVQEYKANHLNPSHTSESIELVVDTLDGARAGNYFEACDLPMFWNTGMLEVGAMADSNYLDQPIRWEDVRVHQYNDTQQIITIRIPADNHSYDEYDLDLSMDSAVTRKASYNRKNELRSETYVTWVRENDAWQPASWKQANYASGARLMMATECETQLLECGADLTTTVFRIIPDVGEKYYDASQKQTLVKSKGREPDVPLELHQIHEELSIRRWQWIVSISLVVAGISTGAWWVRTRHTRSLERLHRP